MPTKNIVPRANGEGSLGTSAKKWGAIYANEIVLANEQTLEAKLNAQDAGIASRLSAQDTTISVAIASQDESISTRLSAQDAEISSRLGAQDNVITQLSDEKVDLTTFNALAGTSEIVASGEYYTRWANGLQICWSAVVLGAVTFPQAFSVAPVVCATSNANVVCYVSGLTATGFNAGTSGNAGAYRYIAIGKWK